MHISPKARTAPRSSSVRFRSILIFSLILSFMAFTLFKNAGSTNAQFRTEASDHGPLAPQSNSWTNNQNASVVLGQAAFNTNASGVGLNQMSFPFGVTVDPTTGK